MSEGTVDVTQVLDGQKITGFNVGLVILAFLVMMTDGYDLGAAAFAGPGLIKEWGLRTRTRCPALELAGRGPVWAATARLSRRPFWSQARHRRGCFCLRSVLAGCGRDLVAQ